MAEEGANLGPREEQETRDTRIEQPDKKGETQDGLVTQTDHRHHPIEGHGKNPKKIKEIQWPGKR